VEVDEVSMEQDSIIFRHKISDCKHRDIELRKELYLKNLGYSPNVCIPGNNENDKYDCCNCYVFPNKFGDYDELYISRSDLSGILLDIINEDFYENMGVLNKYRHNNLEAMVGIDALGELFFSINKYKIDESQFKKLCCNLIGRNPLEKIRDFYEVDISVSDNHIIISPDNYQNIKIIKDELINNITQIIATDSNLIRIDEIVENPILTGTNGFGGKIISGQKVGVSLLKVNEGARDILCYYCGEISQSEKVVIAHNNLINGSTGFSFCTNCLIEYLKKETHRDDISEELVSKAL
jgi:hypothetical protein